LEEALAAYRRALHLQPERAEVHSNLVYTLQFHPGADAARIAGEQQCWNQRFGEPLRSSVPLHLNERNPERRLRVGYVSADFRDHVVGRNLVPLFRNHDRENLEIVCYSGVLRPDGVTAEIRRHADLWRHTPGVTDEALAAAIRQDGVDILVDLAQHMAGNRLPVFARQPAPVQVSFAGYPAGTGVEAIGYRISDRYLEAEMEDGRSEIGGASSELRSFISDLRPAEEVLFIDSFWCYDPCGMEVEVNALPAQDNGRVTFGSLNNFCKINEGILKVWARVLGRVKDSRLVLLSPLGSHRQRTWEFLEREGIAASRVEFVALHPRREYLELYHGLDIVLDPFPYGGHTTSLDALWMGVPVVSLAGERSVSRAGLSQLTHLGLRELVASSEDDYVGIAGQLAGDLPRLAELRRTLRPRMEASVLMDAPRFARQIEAAYRSVWRQWCQEG
jgi:protein O-GlcNAc transferase